ncbi:heterokaryon incompatibility [Xylariaceae sp. FL0255]|nr:heterokaryon incompatibility [Xylariaceae sp. FL0255]
MRLLNTTTLELANFDDEFQVSYAILSHTWGRNEIQLQDLQDTQWKARPEARKVQESARIAVKRDLAYIWIDTCCIDKSSSAELSEAINSMYRWYERSAICIAYLSDVNSQNEDVSSDEPDIRFDQADMMPDEEDVAFQQHFGLPKKPSRKSFGESRWFSRGY